MDALPRRAPSEMPNAKQALRVLVIDDDGCVGAATRTILARRNGETEIAARTQVGIQALESSRFDVVLVDLFMPGDERPRHHRAYPARISNPNHRDVGLQKAPSAFKSARGRSRVIARGSCGSSKRGTRRTWFEWRGRHTRCPAMASLDQPFKPEASNSNRSGGITW
jgi:CheY-like chemotaxis protein